MPRRRAERFRVSERNARQCVCITVLHTHIPTRTLPDESVILTALNADTSPLEIRGLARERPGQMTWPPSKIAGIPATTYFLTALSEPPSSKVDVHPAKDNIGRYLHGSAKTHSHTALPLPAFAHAPLALTRGLQIARTLLTKSPSLVPTGCHPGRRPSEIPTLDRYVRPTISECVVYGCRHRLRLPGCPVSAARCSIAAAYPPPTIVNDSRHKDAHPRVFTRKGDSHPLLQA